jgi:hypothetical protein
MVYNYLINTFDIDFQYVYEPKCAENFKYTAKRTKLYQLISVRIVDLCT